MLIFVSIVLTILGLLHWFLYARLVSALDITSPTLLWPLRVLAAFLAVSYILGRILEQRMPGALAHAIDWIASIWVGMMWQFLWITFLFFLVKVVLVLSGQWSGMTFETQAALGRYSFYFVSSVVVLMCGYGIYKATGPARLVEVDVPVENWRPEWENFKIAMVADFHASTTNGPSNIEPWCEQISALGPDVILAPGDIVDTPARQIMPVAKSFSILSAPQGVFSTTGNHEYYVGVNGSVQLMREGGFNVLMNQTLELSNGIRISGIEDRTARQMGGTLPPFEALIPPDDSSEFRILLMHTPATGDVQRAIDAGFNLVVSGHTHGGQMFPFTLFTKMAFPYHHGLYKVHEGYQLTTCGIGYWGPPMRIGKPPEIMLIRLVPGDRPARCEWK
ncbi:MAG: metallophosphoesterase [Calditrichaeota bacterium]|nr:metallophosphoesterase [Calditrichota bacterium]MCB9391964.1 metallophosphoesterase [Calditrichota bacterium]